MGLLSRTTLANEFGKLSDKASCVLSLELAQVIETAADIQILVSKIIFIEAPGTEILHEDPESLKIRQGDKLNRSLLGLQEVIISLASGKVI